MAPAAKSKFVPIAPAAFAAPPSSDLWPSAPAYAYHQMPQLGEPESSWASASNNNHRPRLARTFTYPGPQDYYAPPPPMPEPPHGAAQVHRPHPHLNPRNDAAAGRLPPPALDSAGADTSVSASPISPTGEHQFQYAPQQSKDQSYFPSQWGHDLASSYAGPSEYGAPYVYDFDPTYGHVVPRPAMYHPPFQVLPALPSQSPPRDVPTASSSVAPPSIPSMPSHTPHQTPHASPSKPPAKNPPRPPNAWILYRSDMLRRIAAGDDIPLMASAVSEMNGSTSGSEGDKGKKKDSGVLALGVGKAGRGLPQSDISKMISLCWKREPKATREYYEQLSRVKKMEHQQKYPGYKFQPQRKEDKLAQKAERAREREDKKRERETRITARARRRRRGSPNGDDEYVFPLGMARSTSYSCPAGAPYPPVRSQAHQEDVPSESEDELRALSYPYPPGVAPHGANHEFQPQPQHEPSQSYQPVQSQPMSSVLSSTTNTSANTSALIPSPQLTPPCEESSTYPLQNQPSTGSLQEVITPPERQEWTDAAPEIAMVNTYEPFNPFRPSTFQAPLPAQVTYEFHPIQAQAFDLPPDLLTEASKYAPQQDADDLARQWIDRPQDGAQPPIQEDAPYFAESWPMSQDDDWAFHEEAHRPYPTSASGPSVADLIMNQWMQHNGIPPEPEPEAYRGDFAFENSGLLSQVAEQEQPSLEQVEQQAQQQQQAQQAQAQAQHLEAQRQQQHAEERFHQAAAQRQHEAQQQVEAQFQAHQAQAQAQQAQQDATLQPALMTLTAPYPDDGPALTANLPLSPVESTFSGASRESSGSYPSLGSAWDYSSVPRQVSPLALNGNMFGANGMGLDLGLDASGLGADSTLAPPLSIDPSQLGGWDRIFDDFGEDEEYSSSLSAAFGAVSAANASQASSRVTSSSSAA